MPVSAGVAADIPKKIGVFLGGFGDVDNEQEIKGLVTNTICDEDIVPLPGALRKFFAWLRWLFGSTEIKHEYAAIGGASHMRATSQAQVDAVAQKLREKGLDAKGYFGFNFTFPSVAEGLKKAKEDGVEQLIVFYMGAQYSFVTAYVLFRDVHKYLCQHPEWNVQVVAVKSFSKDKRFVDLMAASIQKRIEQDFPGEPAGNVCIFLPMHGTIMKLLKQGDPYYDQAMYVVDALRQIFPKHPLYYGFQNHDLYPFIKWTQPSVDVALDCVAKDACPNVVIDGRISFTVDGLETLYDQGVAAKNDLIAKSHKAGHDKKVVTNSMFNNDVNFVDFLAALSLEALQGQGDLLPITRSPVLKR